MDVHIIQKILQQRKYMGIFLVDIQCQQCAFDPIENKHNLYRGKYCMKKFCESSREKATNVINFEKRKILSITKKRVKTTPRCNRMLHLWKKILK